MEENEKIESQSSVENSQNNYIETIKKMKENMVEKDAYDKLVEENKQLLDAYVQNQRLEGDEPKEQPFDVDKARDTLFNTEGVTNLEFIDTTLKLREELIKRGEKDPFLPFGKNIQPTDEDYEKAEKVAKVLQSCVEVADGNPDIFTNELQRVLVDPILPKRKR